MKIVFTVHDGGMAAYVGGSVESVSSIIEIDDDQLPANVKQYLDITRRGGIHYLALSLSFIDDQAPTTTEMEARS